MIKVITYGTYDLLHYGHIRLLERAKALGDYLIVGVTADAFDRARGKINVQQSLMERIEAVRATGIPDEIIVEEYEGQKIDDIRRLGVDIFTVGSDWVGKFDYLNEYCKVVYLDRTEGVSSSDLRAHDRLVRLGIVGESSILNKIENESRYVNGLQISGVFTLNDGLLSERVKALPQYNNLYDLLSVSDAAYFISHPTEHYKQIKSALEMGKHVLCESPLVLETSQWQELYQLAGTQNCVLMDSIKTAYSMAYNRLGLLVKSGRIGQIVSVDATCTSLQEYIPVAENQKTTQWNSICAWGPTALLPVFQLLGTKYCEKRIASHFKDKDSNFDMFTKISFTYPHAVASVKVGKGVKSEGELVVSGTKGYIYVPAPWWKTDYFELRYENQSNNKRYFYQLDGEGIRYMLVTFLKAIAAGKSSPYIDDETSLAIVQLIEDFVQRRNVTLI